MKHRITTAICTVLLAIGGLRTHLVAEEPVLTETPVAPAVDTPPAAEPAPVPAEAPPAASQPAADNLPAVPPETPAQTPATSPAGPAAAEAPVAVPAASKATTKDAPVEMIRIAEGDFLYGETKKVVILKAFHIDRTEVTVDQYRKCVNAGKCLPPGTWDTCNWGSPDKGMQPVNCVDWHDADTFCRWTGKRLPTEAEWEKAARGADGRSFPWGEQPPDCDHAVMAQPSGAGCGQGRSWAVCSKADGNTPEEACDFAGNLWEYTTDAYETPALRALRGGAWSTRDPNQLKTISRIGVGPSGRSYNFGFRCAK